MASVRGTVKSAPLVWTLNTVPNSYREVNASINHGDPLIKTARGNAVSRNLVDFADALSTRTEENRTGGLLGRLFNKRA